jgi:hypothetical protein
MNKHIALVVMMMAAACGKGHKDAGVGSGVSVAVGSGSGSGSAAAPVRKMRAGVTRPQPKLTATFDGKPVTMTSALAVVKPDGKIVVSVSTDPLNCKDVVDNDRKTDDGEVTFDVTVVKGLQPDGSMQGVIVTKVFGVDNATDSTPTALNGDGTADKPTTVDVDFSIDDAKTPPRKLVVKGTIDALGCAAPAEAAKPAAAPLPPEMPATIEIAGKKLPIRGAFYYPNAWPVLKLTTGGETCSYGGGTRGDLETDLDWTDPKKNPSAIGQIQISGALIDGGMGDRNDKTFDKTKISVTPTPKGAGTATLKADIMIKQYPLKLDGKVTIVACPKQ